MNNNQPEQPEIYFTPGQVVKDSDGKLYTVVHGNDCQSNIMTVRPWEPPYTSDDLPATRFTLTDQELTIEQILEQVHGLSISAEFVPWSKSKYKEPTKLDPEPRPGLSWTVTISRNGRYVITTDYKQGVGHIPNDWGNSRKPWASRERNRTTESGKYPVYKPSDAQAGYDFDRNWVPKSKPLPTPTLAEVMYCLVLDSNVLNAGGFENWASEYGYDTDSISCKQMYEIMINQALVLRGGGLNLDQLSELFQDY